MEIIEEEQGEWVILHVTGRVDATNSPKLDKQVNDLIDNNHHKIVMDFTNVEYLSSAGMRLLLSGTKKTKSLGGKFVICSLTDDVMEIIKMAGFNHILHIVSTLDKAVKDY